LERMADAAWTFVLLNTAAAVALVKFVSGRKIDWRRPERTSVVAISSHGSSGDS